MRGLKQKQNPHNLYRLEVAPYVGAWIETKDQIATMKHILVAPYVGAWIETLSNSESECEYNCRTLRGCVD